MVQCLYCSLVGSLTRYQGCSAKALYSGYWRFDSRHEGDPAQRLLGDGFDLKAFLDKRLVRIRDLQIPESCQCLHHDRQPVRAVLQHAGNDNLDRHLTGSQVQRGWIEGLRRLAHRLVLRLRGRDHA